MCCRAYFHIFVLPTFVLFHLRASRLGLDACLATKVGSDANGRLILEGLKDEGVDVSRVIVSGATPSAFTYIIVDKEGGTRTCLHTPQTEGAPPFLSCRAIKLVRKYGSLNTRRLTGSHYQRLIRDKVIVAMHGWAHQTI